MLSLCFLTYLWPSMKWPHITCCFYNLILSYYFFQQSHRICACVCVFVCVCVWERAKWPTGEAVTVGVYLTVTVRGGSRDNRYLPVGGHLRSVQKRHTWLENSVGDYGSREDNNQQQSSNLHHKWDNDSISQTPGLESQINTIKMK